MDEQSMAGPGQQLSWLLDDLGERIEHFRQAVILSRDGLAVASSKNLSREDAEHLSALAAGVPGARESSSGSAMSGRPSSSWNRRSCLLPRRVMAAAWPCSARRAWTQGSSPTRWRCW